ncbi:MAG: excinuclease ABC subunit UvrC [Firmicutes bacterium]|nr:excinuclease ABC subunit UvrC [Bacillota bacterium]
MASTEILTFDEMVRKAHSLPLKPGVYMYYDREGTVIYVGKSKALRNRVSSYLVNPDRHPPKTRRLVKSAVNFETIVTSSETEALILENELIKKYQPKYNILLKDDKSYPYLRLSTGDDYPTLSLERSRSRKKDDKSMYFGPYSSAGAVWGIINTANSIFRLPVCRRSFPRDIGKARPCLYYHMNKCVGVCTGKVSKTQYAEQIKRLVSFLKNDYRSVCAQMRTEMNKAAEALEFERAAQLRDSIASLEKLCQHQSIVGDLSFEADVFGLFTDDIGSCVSLMIIREGRLIDMINYHFGADGIIGEEKDSDSVSALITGFYSGRDDIPKRILVSHMLCSSPDIAAADLLSEKSGKKVHILCPERGENRRLTNMADANAKEAELHKRELYRRDEKTLIKLAQTLCLEVLPEKIEAIDISNNGKDDITAGIICIKNARFSKKDYRSFNINTGLQDDYAATEEALRRRFARALTEDGDSHWKELPDLLLLDGGAGHVMTVKRLLSEIGLDIPTFGMVKDDFHKTRCLTDGEHEISIAGNTAVFNFIYKIQEEVHRFAFSRMDNKRRKKVKQSSLTKISGIGAKKADLLLRHFGTIANLAAAEQDEIAEVRGISAGEAHNIYRHFHPGDKA